MTQETELTIIIPAYNEAESLRWFLPQVCDFCRENRYHLIVVDDCSSDQTLSLLQEAAAGWDGMEVIHHKVNQGYGGAIISGLSASITPFSATMDADGQHQLSDIRKLLETQHDTNADLVIGSRPQVASGGSGLYRALGKKLIHLIAGMLVELPINDLNSGMKLYDTVLVQKYLPICPSSMAFSDIITLIFLQKKHLVVETPIQITERKSGKSTINTLTALDTILQVLNIVMVFNPMRIFMPCGLIAILVGVLWAIPFLVQGHGLSTASMLAITTGLILTMLGLIAEQLSQIRRKDL